MTKRDNRRRAKLLVGVAWSITAVMAASAVAALSSEGGGRATADQRTYSYADIASSYGDISKLPLEKQLAIRNQVSEAIPTFTSTPALDPFTDSGPSADIAGVKADLVADVNAWLAAQGEPLTQGMRQTNLASSVARAARDNLMASAWTASQRSNRISELESALQSAQSDQSYHPYDDARLSIINWSGVQVAGDTAFALLTAAPYMHRSCGWVTGAIDQWQVALTRETDNSGMKSWKLVDFKRIDIGLNNRADPSC